MSDLDRILAAARDWAPARLALATVVSTWGSAPRPRGSHMLVHEDGRFEGSISGGCVEGEILVAAAEVIAGAPVKLLDYGVADPQAWEVGLPCGGSIRVLVQPVSEAGFPPALFDAVAEARADGRSLSLATDLASGISRDTSQTPFVSSEVETPPRGSLDFARDEGTFVNLYRPPRRLLIVGAVQIAQALAGLARELDIAAVVIDPRGRFLTAERFPGVELDDRWPDEAVAARRPDAATALVTLSHDIKIDDPALAAALRAETGYVAALGSRKSHAARRERLAALGFDEAQLDRIDGPAGLDLGAVGPAEIALSIAAGMIAAFNAA